MGCCGGALSLRIIITLISSCCVAYYVILSPSAAAANHEDGALHFTAAQLFAMDSTSIVTAYLQLDGSSADAQPPAAFVAAPQLSGGMMYFV